MIAGWVVMALGLPLLVLFVSRRVAAIQALSPVVICFALGLILATLGAPLPEREVLVMTAGVGVILGVPLLLLTSDFRQWLRLARGTALAAVLGFVSVTVVVLATAPLFAAHVPEAWKVAGMLTGTYTGSGPNLAAIGAALDVDPNMLLLVATADLLVAGCYALFLLSPGVAVFAWVLPPAEKAAPVEAEAKAEAPPIPPREWASAATLGLSIAALGVAVSRLLPGPQEATAILTVTTVAIAASFHAPVRANRAAYPLGDYVLLIFCLAFGCLCDLTELTRKSTGWVLGWTTTVVVGATLLHLLCCRLLRVDRDTFVITSAAALFNPAIIAPIASNLRNMNVLIGGLGAALFGLAIGNYLGLAVGYAARALLGG